MRASERRQVISILHMSVEDRLEHIGHFRAREQELREMSRWFGADVGEARSMLLSRITACDRTVAMLEDM